MSNDLNFYINGEWVKSESNETIDVINPANEEVIGQVTAGTKEDIDKAVSAALDAFSSKNRITQKRNFRI
jgi:aldehyde dehydrogenase (NAD+)